MNLAELFRELARRVGNELKKTDEQAQIEENDFMRQKISELNLKLQQNQQK